VAATNPMFTASWERWPNGWCLGCHAPRIADQVARLGRAAVPGVVHPLPPRPDAPWSEGVGCATCHVREGTVWTAGAPSAAAQEAHPTAQDPALADERRCASCHQFNFQRHTPRSPFALGPTPAQDTVAEWASSKAAHDGARCQDCHMGEHGHAFVGPHTPGLVAATVQIEVERHSDDLVRATLRAPGAAHRVPSGDPFRRMVFEACADPVCADVVGSASVRRVFEPSATSWRLFADLTLPPERRAAPSERVLDVPTARPAVAWRLLWRHGEARFDDQLPPDEVGFVVHAGALPPVAPPPR
jgi:hypothetical protein